MSLFFYAAGKVCLCYLTTMMSVSRGTELHNSLSVLKLGAATILFVSETPSYTTFCVVLHMVSFLYHRNAVRQGRWQYLVWYLIGFCFCFRRLWYDKESGSILSGT